MAERLVGWKVDSMVALMEGYLAEKMVLKLADLKAGLLAVRLVCYLVAQRVERWVDSLVDLLDMQRVEHSVATRGEQKVYWMVDPKVG